MTRIVTYIISQLTDIGLSESSSAVYIGQASDDGAHNAPNGDALTHTHCHGGYDSFRVSLVG